MKTVDVFAELQKAALDAFHGTVDPAESEEACRRMDKMREEMTKKTGDIDVAVDLVREVRDE